MSDRALTLDPLAAKAGVVVKTDPHACFGCGDLNTIGLQLEIHHAPGLCWAELEIPERFQGWEGVAHGGVVSTVLDEVMTWSLLDRDLWGVTARLTVNFKKPVPIGRPIRAEGRLVEVRRRIVATAGRIVDIETGAELATAEATFVAADATRKAQLQERYGNLFARLTAAREKAAAGSRR
jgi:uncharacterized protein (TIGR00369 family)